MRKKFVVFCLAAIMFFMPINAAIAGDLPDENTESLNIPEFYITQYQYDYLESFINKTFDQKNKTKALAILENVVDEDLKVDMVDLADELIHYNFERIDETKLYQLLDMSLLRPHETINQLKTLITDHWNIVNGEFVNNLFVELLGEIVKQIQNRLGWTHQFFSDGLNLIKSGTALAVNYIRPAIATISVYIVIIINDIISAPKEFASGLQALFQGGDATVFIDKIIDVIETFSDDIDNLIESIKGLVENETLLAFLDQTQEYIQWLQTSPWNNKIRISGTAKTFLLNTPVVGATVRCRGVETTTDSNGRYELTINPPSDASDSIPANSVYGLHNCTITISKDGKVLKQSTTILSYTFSGGRIDWPFIIRIRDVYSPIINRIIDIINAFQEILTKEDATQDQTKNTDPLPPENDNPLPPENGEEESDPEPSPPEDPIVILTVSPTSATVEENETVEFTVETTGGSGNNYYLFYGGDDGSQSGYMGSSAVISYTYSKEGTFEPDVEVHDLDQNHYDSSYNFAIITVMAHNNQQNNPI